MIEFMEIPAPTSFPWACVGCMSQKGPMIDTHRELPGYGHVFVCVRCAKTAARLLGFAKGDKLDELSQAADAVHERELEIGSLREQLVALGSERDGLNVLIRELKDELSLAHARVTQLEGAFADEAKRALSLVGDVA